MHHGVLSNCVVVISNPQSQSVLQQQSYGRWTSNRYLLSLIEAFYLTAEISILTIASADGQILITVDELWSYCCHLSVVGVSPHFAAEYRCYCLLKRSGFRIRSGSKLGVDFLLYSDLEQQQQPPHHQHSKFSAVIRCLCSSSHPFDLSSALTRIQRTTKKVKQHKTKQQLSYREDQQQQQKLMISYLVIDSLSNSFFVQ